MYSLPKCYEYLSIFAKISKRTNCSGQHIDNRREAIANKYVHFNRIVHCFLISQHTDNLFLFICALILSDGVSKNFAANVNKQNPCRNGTAFFRNGSLSIKT